jgi:hypothetical protein
VGICVNVRQDRVQLTLPDDDLLAGVGRIVVGGLCARLDASYESLDDVQLAVESVLGEWRDPGSATTVEIEVLGDGLAIAIGPLRPAAGGRAAAPNEVGVAEVLATVVDAHRVVQRDTGRWLLLEKRMPGIDV